jgi:hypothetical protein
MRVANLTTIEGLRRFAELNLCPTCFRKYKSLIEPTVKSYLFNPLCDWRRAESYICQVAMRTAGAYKTDINVIPGSNDKKDLNNEFSKFVDEAVYKKVKHWSFKKRIEYLHEQNIIGDSGYTFLEHAKNVRNKIHDDLAEFSQEDLTLLEMASVIASQYFYATVSGTNNDLSKSIKSNAEVLAKELTIKFGLSF